jgi:hypothetical protein
VRKNHPILRRVLSFVLFVSTFPLLLAVVSWVLYRGSGLRGSSPGSFAVLTWGTDSGFVVRQVVLAVLGTLVVAVILGLGSLLAWDSNERHSLLRVGRFVALIWLVSIVLFPGIAAWMPLLRRLPWSLGVVLLLVAIGAGYAWRGARAGTREWVFAGVALAVLFFSPRFSSKHLDGIAQRQFAAHDVILIGFDSVNTGETVDVLRQFEPRYGQKIVFVNAQTPFPATSVAWRSMFSGQYPPSGAAIPGLRWGSDRAGWLPSDLRAAGYDPTIAQDMPEANWFGASESIRAIGLQGWKVPLQATIWKAAFPLSIAGARWWVRLLGGPSTWNGRPAHCAECFVADALMDIAGAATKGPVFAAIHTCLAHGPNQLKLAEALRVPGWWRLPPTFFLGQQGSDPRSRVVRMDTLRRSLRNTLEFLDQGGALGRATVFVLADHGPRGEGVPRAVTNNVMLAMFIPGDRSSTMVTVPVSLVDIAPTIRQIVGLPDVATDGRVLPHVDADGDPHRLVRTTTVPRGGILDSLGLGKRSMSASELGKLGQLHSDGTFDYSPEFIERVQRLQLRPSSEHDAPQTRTQH